MPQTLRGGGALITPRAAHPHAPNRRCMVCHEDASAAPPGGSAAAPAASAAAAALRAHLSQRHLPELLRLGAALQQHWHAAPPSSFVPPTFACPHSSAARAAATGPHAATRAKLQALPRLNGCTAAPMAWLNVPVHLLQVSSALSGSSLLRLGHHLRACSLVFCTPLHAFLSLSPSLPCPWP